MMDIASVVRSIVTDADDETVLWNELRAGGFDRVGLPDEVGGSGGDITDLADVVHELASAGQETPLVDSWLAAYLLFRAGVPLPDGVLTYGVEHRVDGDLEAVRLPNVPHASRADWVLTIDQSRAVLVPASQCQVEVGHSIAGDERSAVIVSVADATVLPDGEWAQRLLEAGALLRSVQLSGAMSGAVAHSVRHCHEREQFGRAIGSFQAVQHLLAEMAGEAFVCMQASRTALGMREQPGNATAVAAAKSTASLAGHKVARIAHQVHGAMGIAGEHPLHTVTTRIWAWAGEHGNAEFWAGHLVEACQGRDVWEWMTEQDWMEKV